MIRFLMEATHSDIFKVMAELIKAAVTDSQAFGQGINVASDIMEVMDKLGIMDATGISSIVSTVKTMVIIGVLFSVICAVVSAALEKPGVALELFAYGYTLAAVLCLSAEQSSLLSAVLAIVVGALLGALGYRISRMWIIITTSLVDGLVATGGIIILAIIPLWFVLLMIFLPIAGIYVQLKITAVTKDKAAQPAAGPAQSTEFVPEFVPGNLSAQHGATPTLGRTPPAGGQGFCAKCGSPLELGARFCGKCGQPTQSGGDAERPE